MAEARRERISTMISPVWLFFERTLPESYPVRQCKKGQISGNVCQISNRVGLLDKVLVDS